MTPGEIRLLNELIRSEGALQQGNESCPDINVLVTLAERGRDSDLARAFWRHVVQCASCGDMYRRLEAFREAGFVQPTLEQERHWTENIEPRLESAIQRAVLRERKQKAVPRRFRLRLLVLAGCGVALSFAAMLVFYGYKSGNGVRISGGQQGGVVAGNGGSASVAVNPGQRIGKQQSAGEREQLLVSQGFGNPEIAVPYSPGLIPQAAQTDLSSRMRSQYQASIPSRLGTTIPAGATISVNVSTEINSKAATVGEEFPVAVDEPLVVNGTTAVPKGTEAVVRVLDSRRVTERTVQVTFALVRLGNGIPLETRDLVWQCETRNAGIEIPVNTRLTFTLSQAAVF